MSEAEKKINSGYSLGTCLYDCSSVQKGWFPYSDIASACENFIERKNREMTVWIDGAWEGAFFTRLQILNKKRCRGIINLDTVVQEDDGKYYYLKLKTSTDSDLIKRVAYMGRRLEEDLENILKLQDAGHLKIIGFYTGEKLSNQ